MITPTSFAQHSSFVDQVISSRESGSPGNQDNGPRPRSEIFSPESTRYNGAGIDRLARQSVELPELGNALRDLYAGQVRRDINTPSAGSKLMITSSQMADRVLHFAFNQ